MSSIYSRVHVTDRDHGNARTSRWCDGSTDLSKTRKSGAGRQLPRQSVCTVNWQRIGGRACNSTGKLSAFQTSLYAGRTHTSQRFLCFSGGRRIMRSRSVTLYALKASTSYPYFGTRIIILMPLTPYVYHVCFFATLTRCSVHS